MNKPLTIKQLKKFIDDEIKKGNGDKVIMISDDDEGNGYHYLWYALTPAEELLHGDDYCIDDRIASVVDTMILG